VILTWHKNFVPDHLRVFKPDLVHIIGRGDIGFLGLGLWVAHIFADSAGGLLAHQLTRIPFTRLNRVTNLMPQRLRSAASTAVERESLRGLLRVYQTARFVLAPKQTLVDLLHARTGKTSLSHAARRRT
jgi:hypothetical protein